MARLLITQHLVEGSLDGLRGTTHEVEYRDEPTPIPRPELLERIARVDAVVCLLSDVIDQEVLAHAPSLKVVANVAVGYDNIDLAAAHLRGVAVVNTPGVLDASTADVAMALMLSARRRTSDAEATLRSGRWAGWAIDKDLGLDLTGACLGLVGYGRIARRVATRAAGFDMSVLHHTRHATGAAGWVRSLEQLAERSDIVSIHVPLTRETHHLISREILGLMAPTSVVVNTSRGPVIDEEALADALESGRLWGAGLDVFDGEPHINPRLLTAPHTVLLPHIGSATVSTRRAMCDLALRGAIAVLNGEVPANLVRDR